jgi:hypothetical protein
MSAAGEDTSGEDPSELGCPESVEQLYDARGDEVDALRPVCQGDVYSDLQMPGFDDDQPVILIAHPCSMRTGASLRPRLQACPVRTYQKVPLRKWTGHGKVLPLPELRTDSGHHAGFLTETGVVETKALGSATRIARLSKDGILFLQQRIVYTLTHAIVGLDTLAEHSAVALEEIELLESWNEELCSDLPDGDLQAGLDKVAHEFEEFMLKGARAKLIEPTTRGQARAEIRAEAKRRREDRDGKAKSPG